MPNLDPTGLTHVSCAVQTAQMHGPPSAALWRWVASSIKMSPAQQQDCMKVRFPAWLECNPYPSDTHMQHASCT